MRLRTLKIMLSWLLLTVAAGGIAAVFMQMPWVYLLTVIISFIILWAILSIVEWKEWRQMTKDLQ